MEKQHAHQTLVDEEQGMIVSPPSHYCSTEEHVQQPEEEEHQNPRCTTRGIRNENLIHSTRIENVDIVEDQFQAIHLENREGGTDFLCRNVDENLCNLNKLGEDLEENSVLERLPSTEDLLQSMEQPLLGDFSDSTAVMPANSGSSLEHREELMTVNMCMEKIISLASKEKMLCVEQEEKYAEIGSITEKITSWASMAKNLYAAEKEAQSNYYYLDPVNLMAQVHYRDNTIEFLRMELHKRDMAINKHAFDLRVKCQLFEALRKSLKQTEGAFSEYRKSHPDDPDKPLHMDVPGSGVVVPSVNVLGKACKWSVKKKT